MNFFQFAKIQIQTIKSKDPSVHSALECLFFPSYKAMTTWYWTHKMYQKKHYSIARIISLKCQKKTGIDIHPGAQMDPTVFIDHGMGVVIGETAIVAKDVMIYQQVTLGATGKITGKRHPNVEEGVIVGAGSKIIGNITLGKYSKIGAGSIIVKDVPPFCTMVPAASYAIKMDDKRIPVLTIPALQKQINEKYCNLYHKVDEIEQRLH